jgi:hypothetical protein
LFVFCILLKLIIYNKIINFKPVPKSTRTVNDNEDIVDQPPKPRLTGGKGGQLPRGGKFFGV